ncbi:unnamed protein product [Parascedosporium putredinis]|uniref:Uncharacterized protein n=1 Tax=Parascedosporium putredinis TaxID=1442378 RepID=A0A9P1H1U2_9PEZI|nr:unnamed protein product [Parascedosporium putredinis]CAI7995469.1 unnamed protein product [Parascedosporium putredinis]
MDLRVTELESRVEEVEKAINDSASQSGTRGNRLDTSCSVASEATSTTTRAMYSSELFSQVQSLQAQVTKMQAALPSFEHPWEVEVVFLPFPLRKIWQGTDEFKTEPNHSATDEWTQLPSTYSASTSRARSPLGGEWAENHQSEWLLPKACGPNGLVDRRLRSRGFIRTISVKGPDARSVQVAMQAVFGGLFRELRAGQASTPSQRRSLISRVGDFRGLAHDWVPLRKVHKDSRLRFLSPSEMVSASLWDIQFLNSVIMKSSEPRLFITQPQAYVQDMHAFEGGWTWQRLRELPRFSTESPSLGGEPLHKTTACLKLTVTAILHGDRVSSAILHSHSRTHPRPAREPSTSGAVAKRRPTRSPSRARFTPRWSTKSPSPMVNGHRLRSTTPFNYATPYSNGPGVDAYPALPHNARHSGGHRDAFGLDVDDHEHDEEEDDDDDDNNYDDDDGDNEGGYSEEVEIYDEGSSGGYGEVEAGVGGAHAAQYPYSDLELDYVRRQLPEDEPWPGIEDRMSDGKTSIRVLSQWMGTEIAR